MALSKFNRVKLSGISVVVPEREISIYDELCYYGGNAKKVDRLRKMVGFHKRRVVEPNVTPADLAQDAAEKLFSSMNLDKSAIDALIFVVQYPDYVAPATALYLHKQLGLSQSCMAFDINLGCSGWVYGAQLAHSMIESGANKRVLLLVADTSSVKIDIKDRINAPLFGDAGSASLFEYCEETQEPTYFNLGSDGSGYDAIITPAGGARLPLKFGGDYPADYNDILTSPIVAENGFTTNLTRKYMDGMKVFNFTMTIVPRQILELMEYAGVSEPDIEALVLHQANKQIVESVCDAVGFPREKASFSTFEKYGNQAGVSVPCAICDTLQDKITSKSGVRTLCSGFGIGLSWGSCIMRLSDVHSTGVKLFTKAGEIPSREKVADFWIKKIQNK